MSSETLAVVRPCTYPARPINGGSLERALPKPGHWYYEPKYNGWRALVHAPTGTMFNRRGQPLSIAGLFSCALERLRTVRLQSGGVPVEWFDCEALPGGYNRTMQAGYGSLSGGEKNSGPRLSRPRITKAAVGAGALRRALV